jgi:hypothetical protein
MSPDRWNYLKSLRPPAGRYLHTSLVYQAVRNPVNGVVSYHKTGKGSTYRKQ